MDSLLKMVKDLSSQFAQGLVSIEERFQKAEDKLVHNSCSSCRRSAPHDAKSSASRSLKLHFVGSLPDELMTGDCIKSEGDSPVVELQDSSGSRVKIGLESYVKIKIFVLDGDFEVEDRNDWTAEEFDKNVAPPRKDKGPLLKGTCEISMKNGVVVFDDISFTDNSKSMRNGRFRLGARVVRGLPEGVEIMDAVSKAFKVKERRVKSYRRNKTLNKTLSLTRSPECLIHIGKSLAQKLATEDIHTVQNFLRLYNTNAKALEDILRLPDNKWSELVKNAESCLLSPELYKYSDNASGSEVTLILDCVFNIKAVVFKGTIFKLYAALDDSEKELVHKIRCNAYEKRNKLQESHMPIMTPNREESMASIPHLSAQHLDALTTLGVNPAITMDQRVQDTCSISPKQTHEELYEKQNELQESHTPITMRPTRDEFGTPYSSIPGPSTHVQHPDEKAPDMTRSPTAALVVDPTISTERRDQEFCSTSPHETCQGEQEGLPHPKLQGHHNTEEGHMMGNYNQVDETMLASFEPQLPVGQPQDLCPQYQSFPAPPNADFFSGLEAYFDDICPMTGINNPLDQLHSANVPPQDTSLQSMVEELEITTPYFQLQDYDQPFDSGPAYSPLKRPRFD